MELKTRGKPLHLTPYTVYLITLKLLFCVCLAHARQQDSYRISGTVLSAAIRFGKCVAYLKPGGQITIRKLSAIRGDFRRLIILDNFPYDGNPANINPNDVEDLTILKDAASTFIRGMNNWSISYQPV